MSAVGVLVNPRAGRDVRRLAARATGAAVEVRRSEVTRAIVGAVAAGAERVVLARDPFRLAELAAVALDLDAEIELLDVAFTHGPEDSTRAAESLRGAGVEALLAFGGDGTSRAVVRGWPDVPLVPLCAGTNNVFPLRVEATLAGAAAALVATGQVALADVAEPAKTVRVELPGGGSAFALVDVAVLVDDHVGNLLPVEAAQLRRAVLARAEPAAIGISPVGGLLLPCAAADDFGVDVACVAHGEGGRALRVPLSAGLYGTVHVGAARKLPLGEGVEVLGPCVLAYDGDREHAVGPGASVSLRVLRDGPRVIDVERVMRRAAARGLFVDRGPWRDGHGGSGGSCC